MGLEGNIYKHEEETTDHLGDLDIDDRIILMDLNKINEDVEGIDFAQHTVKSQ
jgi:hypothetical protein